MKEIWRDVKEYEGIYVVSNTGKVKSLNRSIYNPGTKKNMNVSGRILSPKKDKDGYFLVNLSKFGKSKMHRISILVAKSFLENEENLPIVDHIDRNRSNNNLKNLRWVSHSKNINNSDRWNSSHSKYNGVYKSRNKWMSRIRIKNKSVYLGTFYNEILAALKFDDYCLSNNIDRELNIL
jgi:hypothetical protein